MAKLAQIETILPKKGNLEFVLFFCTKQKEVDSYAKALNKISDSNTVVWFCYPKKSSKNYKCEFDRDNGWQSLGAANWEPVRAVAIDNDWSALRFKQPEQIKKMTRTFALTKKGAEKSDLELRSYEAFEQVGESLKAQLSSMFGKACLKAANGKAFACFSDNCIVVKLNEQDFKTYSKLSNAELFNPMGKGKGMTGWLQIPFMHGKKWKSIALKGMNYVANA
jgi:hypothetical protein